MRSRPNDGLTAPAPIVAVLFSVADPASPETSPHPPTVPFKRHWLLNEKYVYDMKITG
jgi:hypothetical protein